jgi:hypothetical protein
MSDAFTRSLNAPAGRLAEVLIKKLTKGEDGNEMPHDMVRRFNTLVSARGTLGKLARVRFAAEVSLLFERAPNWTTQKIVPLFDWSSSDAYEAWAAHKYSNYIGSADLFRLTKQPFLALFSRTDIPDEDLTIFADWLTAIMLANQARQADYPLTATEARTALRQAGVRVLPSVGHRLAVEMERAKPGDKLSTWHNVVGPVFQAIWPLDMELQAAASTFNLVQILRASGNAFPEAADAIIPFIRPEDPRGHTSVYSISEADDVLYSSAPQKMLDLLAAVVGDVPAKGIYGLSKVLDRIRAVAPQLADTRKFQKLVSEATIR